jgi:hypothetical protein
MIGKYGRNNGKSSAKDIRMKWIEDVRVLCSLHSVTILDPASWLTARFT